MRQPRILFSLTCMVLLLSACVASAPQGSSPATPSPSYVLPPDNVREADLIGKWETIFTEYEVETLVINEDYTFTQVFETKQSHQRYEGSGSWRLEQRESGCLYVHFEGMRYFYSGEAFAENGNRFVPGGEPYRFWERCEAQRMTMPDKVILTVVAQPRLPRGMMLLFPATSDDPTSSVTLRLVADAQGQPFATPTPQGP